MKTVESGPV